MKTFFLQNKQYTVGLVLVIISTLFYLLGMLFPIENVDGVFFAHFIITAGYWIWFLVMVFVALLKRETIQFHLIFPGLVLAFISAYALNREITVFHTSTAWFAVTQVLVSVACLSLVFFREMPRYLRCATMFVLGIGLIVFLYLSVFLLSIYPLSLIFFWVLGISLHSFVPLFFVIAICVWLLKMGKVDKKACWAAVGGVGLAVASLAIFSACWAQTVNQINDSYRKTFTEDGATLPIWVRVAQQVPKNSVTNKVLKLDLKYTDSDIFETGWFDFDIPSQFNEQKVHDPFIVVACWFSEKLAITVKERVKILESIYDCRNQAEERLWSDDGVKTSFVNSSILIWPQFRMAYTEQVISIEKTKTDWRSQGEAVYTFHLPEGSVVTSLSLWVNGIEEKGILTTKDKADEAYRTIVGVEARDPSLIHWQEGSTVSIRVFPVTTDEGRVFKVGVTSPLSKVDNRLTYSPVYFEGTDYTQAKSATQVSFMHPPKNLEHPYFLTANGQELNSKSRRKLDANWTISMDDAGLSDKSFYFNGNSYTLGELQTQQVSVDFQDIYLDLNRSWTKDELASVLLATKDRNVWVSDGRKLRKVRQDGEAALLAKQFSLFPIHLIGHPERSLLISKSTSVSPNLSDLEGSPFYKDLKWAADTENIPYFFNLGENLSPYLKTLREYRLLNYTQGGMDTLEKILNESLFPESVPETDSSVTVHDAQLSIIKRAGRQTPGDAPDHLMRMFAYNHIMWQYAKTWNLSNRTIDLLVAEAQQAYVVSPVSSLVVLETQADYDRFDIKDTEVSLYNASKDSSVPLSDINGWELLVLVAILFSYIYMRRKKIS